MNDVETHRDRVLTRDREAVRDALNKYGASLGGALIVEENEREKRQIVASIAEVQAAKRVLWFETT